MLFRSSDINQISNGYNTGFTFFFFFFQLQNVVPMYNFSNGSINTHAVYFCDIHSCITGARTCQVKMKFINKDWLKVTLFFTLSWPRLLGVVVKLSADVKIHWLHVVTRGIRCDSYILVSLKSMLMLWIRLVHIA